MSSTALRRPRYVGLLALVTLLGGLLAGLLDAAPASAEPATQTHTEYVLQRMLLAHLNSERRAHHLPALTLNHDLDLSARRHTIAMDARHVLSHQLSGERSLGSRISATGYHWRAIAENVAWTSAMSSAGVAAVQAAMYSERAPNDGHRLNILSATYRQVGIGVVYDAKQHRVWFTEDFGRLR